MKRVAMVRLFGFLAVLQVLGLAVATAAPSGGDGEETFTRPQIRCETAQRKPCTEEDIRAINEIRKSYTGKRKEAVEHISHVTLIGPRRGILKCEKLDGKPCNAAQRLGLIEVANKNGDSIIIEGAQQTGGDSWNDKQ